MQAQQRLLLHLLLPALAHGSFKLTAGNWTHSTSLFADYHFVPGYNAEGQWDLLTGGNWTPTNHSDANLIGDAEIYLCPCPDPPCDPDPEPEKPGFTTSVFGCVDQDTLNISHSMCTVFHQEKTNVTCVTPDHAIVCDIPYFEANGTLQFWWENDEVPSRSYYSTDVTAISCVIRSLARALPDSFQNFTSAAALQEQISVERCELVCKRVCKTTCTTEHRSLHSLIPELNHWYFDPVIDNNPREFVDNGTLYQERSPAQYLRGTASYNYGQERVPLNMTCTLPTLTATRHVQVMGNSHANLSNVQGIFDMYGRRFNGGNIFDLTLYTALQSFLPLENKRCVTPFPNASNLDLLPGQATPYFDSLVCHQPLLEPYNISLGPAPTGAGSARRQLEAAKQGEGVALSSLDDAVGGRELGDSEGGDDPSGSSSSGSSGGGDEEAAEEAAVVGAPWERFDDWIEWGEGNGSEWDWHHATQYRKTRGDLHWSKRWRQAQRSPPRRRLLYHEFEIDRSPWDYWLDENPYELQARLTRLNAEKTGDCRFYHNCTDPLPPPLLLHVFTCWLPNITVQPNVSAIPPRSLATMKHKHHEVNINTTYDHEPVLCIRPSWPNATGISCLTPRTGLYCPFTDTYRGNETRLSAEEEEYLNQTTIRCTSWPLLDVYRKTADDGILFALPVNATSKADYLDPWERPCDVYKKVAVGNHHYCAIDSHRHLRCTGHNAHGRSSLDWYVGDDVPPGMELTIAAKQAMDAAAKNSIKHGMIPELAEAHQKAARAANPPGTFLDVCAGQYHTCAIEELYDVYGNITGTTLRCWGDNYTNAINPAAVMSSMGGFGRVNGPSKVVCGRRFVCALQEEDPPGPGQAPNPQPGHFAFCTGLAEDRFGNGDLQLPDPQWPTEMGQPFIAFDAGMEHACGVRMYMLQCFGSYPIIPPNIQGVMSVAGVALGGRHTCVGLLSDAFTCFSGSGLIGSLDSVWLDEVVAMAGGTWSAAKSISISDSAACVVDVEGQAHCGGERAQVELNMMRPPVKLQPDRTDLVERGITFSSVRCGGTAARNGTFTQLGEQFCCGLGHHDLVHCWGKVPPHHGFNLPREDINVQGTIVRPVPLGTFQPLNESNASVYHILNRRCVDRTSYLRDFGLRLLLDTHPKVSLADATTNFSLLYTCYDVPRRYTFNASEHANTWLGVNITNTSQLFQQRSWHTTMLLTLLTASYTDGLSCFNFTAPFPQLHCVPMIPYINRTVLIATAPPEPYTIERTSTTDVYSTRFSLAHTRMPDQYCFEKLRLTPSEQFKRGGAWHRATQRVVDGFEAIFTFQIDNSARLCKTVRALVTGTLIYEKCLLTGSDGLAFVLRGGGPPTALGGGGANLGYGGLNRTLAIELDTWYNADMGDLFYHHVSVQTGGPNGVVGPHKEHYLASAAIDPVTYPSGLADGKAHVVRVQYTPGFDAELLDYEKGPAPSPGHLKYWIHEGPIGTTAFPHSQSVGTWPMEGVGILRVFLDSMDKPILTLPIDIGYTLGLDNGRAWVGLTAATGRRFQNHYALAWQFCEGPAGCEEPMTACEAFGCNPMFPSARYNTPPAAEDKYSDLQTGTEAPLRPRSLVHLSDFVNGEPPAHAVHPGMEAHGGGGGGGGGETPPWDDTPSDSTWGAEPAGFKVEYEQPGQEDVIASTVGYDGGVDSAGGAGAPQASMSPGGPATGQGTAAAVPSDEALLEELAETFTSVSGMG